ncbi:cbb3-type cytochrome oxidase assembly protein CcoS [Ancylobacter pratisalsi]|uniref:Cbb3-type cytochrome oxidase assembly protein CcoS n=1 Tax=Ancylobacter pratisalsi TaxID=1745854 RepID=A0A6P1YNX8_9HYPH|nr:cbb3-type cytochrome oxidase assembly protein CcoS [Ancylobacter pratisalsi]QIB34421.1 cbb3-type cytochrome oxidase assembly protein CcoS [Ancylobacter pratisalsi]
MTVLLYLVPAALSLGLLGLGAFLWSLRSGQYEDLDGAAVRVLSDDDLVGYDETGAPGSKVTAGEARRR